MTPQETEKIKLMQLFKQGKIDTLPDVNSDAYKAQKVKDMMSKAEGVDEVTSKVGSRILGMIHRPFLANILEKFAEIYQDLIDNGEEFDAQDVIDFLSIEMSKFADDRGLNASFPNEGKVEEEVVNEEESVDEAMMPRPSLFRGTDVEKQEYYASLYRDYNRDNEEFKRNYMNFTDEDWIEDFENYVADKGIDEGVTWMKRFSGLK
jgi:hypothetical protein